MICLPTLSHIYCRVLSCIGPAITVAIAVSMIIFLPHLAWADLRVCNMTTSRVGVALGYHDEKSWLTEGWWNLGVRECKVLASGDLISRYYYIHAVDYDKGGEWAGHSLMCTREKEFAIRGIRDCLARGYDRSGFFEIDTGQQKNWTIQLTEHNQQREIPH